jgi:glycosyltransferase involved in cell wall biosynthesis
VSGLRRWVRERLPAGLRERYHRHALLRDFGIDERTGSRRATSIDRRLPRGLNVIADFRSRSGVGESARSLADAAERAGLSVARLDVAEAAEARRAGPFDTNLYHVNADGAAHAVEAMGPSSHAGRANVAYWYWECERFPDRWKNRFAYFDEVWVASEFCLRSVAGAATIPVRKTPPAIEIRPSPDDPREKARLAKDDRLFLTLFDALSVPERKNPSASIRAFRAAFDGRHPEALLRVHVSNAGSVPGLVERLTREAGESRVEIRPGALPRADVESSLAACDAYVSLHRAEGFGLPLAEAMSLGKPVVATDFSGSTDYLDAGTGFPVPWREWILPETIRDYERGARWAEPDEAAAAAALRAVLENPEESRRRGEAGRRRIAELYGPRPVGSAIVERIGALHDRLSRP